MSRSAVIIGAGPAGLTAAYELLEHTDVRPIVLEATDDVGGLARTVNYKGNRIDIGGHRFFSKSDRVMQWWERVLPFESSDQGDGELRIAYQNSSRAVRPGQAAADPASTDRVMLVRPRVSRIFFRRQLFPYPIALSLGTLRKLGLGSTIRIGFSYLRVRIAPLREERSLEDFFINRFGRELYRTFFKDYTEKVWGVPCSEIKPEWGAQRVKGVSMGRALWHAVRSLLSSDDSIAQKRAETSLIERFLYPKYGPGQMWQEVAREVRERGGEVRFGREVDGVHTVGGRVVAVEARDVRSGERSRIEADYFFSSMPVRDLVRAFDVAPPPDVARVASGLAYRDFITVGLLLRKLKVRGDERPGMPAGLVPDNWIYIQERDVKIGRLQIFNNWSPYLVKDPSTVWVGLEYFCSEGDELWTMPDTEMLRFAAGELARIDVIEPADVLDGVVIRVPKTYPAYTGTFEEFDRVREWLDGFENLFLIGRNGMHRYNNQDHSMLTAMTAVENVRDGVLAKDNIWAVNTEEEYHEER
ncbi:MAG: NAD(P)/FAD-dependent oxidoreductase [Thermodesulfobacteriota bacterium]